MFRWASQGAVLCLGLSAICGCGGGGGGGRSSSPAAGGASDATLPLVDSFSPAPDVRVKAGEAVNFHVALRPNGGAPGFAWFVDGDLVSSSGPSLRLPTGSQDPSGRSVEVEISDGPSSTVLVWDLRIDDGTAANSHPTIVSATPRGPVTLASDGRVDLGVAAVDADYTDTVSYLWFIDDKAQTARGSSFSLLASSLTPGSHRVEVSVDDGHSPSGQALETYPWDVTVLDPGEAAPPLISWAAPRGAVRLALGTAVLLSAQGTDPRGRALSYAWSVNGAAQSASGTSMAFRPGGSPAMHEVVVTISGGEGSGDRISQTWQVETVEEFVPPPPIVSGAVSLDWDAVTRLENGQPVDVAGYKVYVYRGDAPRDYELVMDVGESTAASIVDLRGGTLYSVAVTAYDSQGNESSFSDPVSVATP